MTEARICIPGERLSFTHERRNVKVRPFMRTTITRHLREEDLIWE